MATNGDKMEKPWERYLRIKGSRTQKDTIIVQEGTICGQQMTSSEESPKEDTPNKEPWRNVTDSDIEEAISGTLLGTMADLYSCVTRPRLPLQAALLKAIVTAGCALSKKGQDNQTGLLPTNGILNAKLRINTAGGQACNIYALLAAHSATGKDVGNLLDNVIGAYDLLLGTSGSAEGIAKALINKPNGLLSISEFMDWLDENKWQNSATSFLTEAFSKGFFIHQFSASRRGGGTIEVNYCYPSIMANIQPEFFSSGRIKTKELYSGFLGRFLLAKMPNDFEGRPANFDTVNTNQNLYSIFDTFNKAHGVVNIDEGYSDRILDEFREYAPERLRPCYRRLANEYMARFATMLAIDETNLENPIVRSVHIEKAEKMVQWFFSQAEDLLMPVEDMDPRQREYVELEMRILTVIAKHPDATISDISNNAGSRFHGKKMEIYKVLEDFTEWHWVTCDHECVKVRGAKFNVNQMKIPIEVWNNLKL